ncbi:hypothetical protein EDC65_1574 [Stella humosa]|uniref:Uncharacterized protein n=1 Tax=Stella humosa TaxID=94 RepID=A0A3N1MAQ8_9PROT|nr:hypothetical protein [Stella humosa]ROP99786.1 hypothetical protein EDC65_1574 [Stella humosa]BBK30987.1 hypothetical protein STHU_16210 [Stella humosa]
MKKLLAAAIALSFISPAMAAPVLIRNCTGAPVDIQVRDGATPQGEVRSAIQNLPLGSNWSGHCGPGAEPCAVRIDIFLSGSVNVLAAGPFCAVPTTDGNMLPLPMNACPC